MYEYALCWLVYHRVVLMDSLMSRQVIKDYWMFGDNIWRYFLGILELPSPPDDFAPIEGLCVVMLCMVMLCLYASLSRALHPILPGCRH